MPSQVSGELPKALDSRTAISGEIPLLPDTRLFSVWRVTPNALAPWATLRPSSSRQSNFTVSPGWGGFFIVIFRVDSAPTRCLGKTAFLVSFVYFVFKHKDHKEH